jgi:regulatory protein
MKITGLSAQQKDQNRINVMVDGSYRFSLDIFQVADLGIRIGKEYSEKELLDLEAEGQFGKLYARALEYCLMRPHSAKEVRDYLYRKTRTTRIRQKKTGLVVERPGVSEELARRVYDRLVMKGYIDDRAFARYWVENRNVTKGASKRKLQAELQAKGVERSIIDHFLAETSRSDNDELQKVIAKKRKRYPDDQKFIQYLARQGYSYDDIKSAIATGDPDDY